MRTFMTGLMIVMALMAGTVTAGASDAPQAESKAVHAAVDQFYSALNTMFTGDMQPMREIWSHADDVTYMGPDGGLKAGWEAIDADLSAQGAKKLGGEVHPEELKMVLGQDMAITSNFERGENTPAGGEPQKVSIRATNVFRKENGQWKMIAHHTDILPYLEKK